MSTPTSTPATSSTTVPTNNTNTDGWYPINRYLQRSGAFKHRINLAYLREHTERLAEPDTRIPSIKLESGRWRQVQPWLQRDDRRGTKFRINVKMLRERKAAREAAEGGLPTRGSTSGEGRCQTPESRKRKRDGNDGGAGPAIGREKSAESEAQVKRESSPEIKNEECPEIEVKREAVYRMGLVWPHWMPALGGRRITVENDPFELAKLALFGVVP